MKKTVFIVLYSLVSLTACAKTGGETAGADDKEYLPAWQEGFLDIHQISTGRGNAALVIMPDGTNLIIDCGDAATSGATEHNEVLPVLPNASKHAAGWVQYYFRKFAPASVNSSTVDYALITHYDGDHIGSEWEPDAVTLPNYGFKLNGITELGELGYYMQIDRLINRSDVSDSRMPANYRRYIEEYRDERGLATEVLRPGENNQIRMLHSPDTYPGFGIRNVVGSRTVWTGTGDATETLPATTDENANSCGILVSYGPFDWLSCGDIPGTNPATDTETAVAKAVGECDVVVACHHGYKDSMNREFCKSTDPQLYVVPVREYWHPCVEAVANMCDETIHSGVPQIYCAGLLASTRATMEEAGFGKYFMKDGHVVIRVTDGGKKFQVFVLDDRSDDYGIVYSSGVFDSRD